MDMTEYFQTRIDFLERRQRVLINTMGYCWATLAAFILVYLLYPTHPYWTSGSVIPLWFIIQASVRTRFDDWVFERRE